MDTQIKGTLVADLRDYLAEEQTFLQTLGNPTIAATDGFQQNQWCRLMIANMAIRSLSGIAHIPVVEVIELLNRKVTELYNGGAHYEVHATL